MLLEFDTEYSAWTTKRHKDVKDATGTDLTFGPARSRTDFFRQMLAGGGGKSRSPSGARPPSPRRADDNYQPGKGAEAGEVGLATSWPPRPRVRAQPASLAAR